MYPSYPSPNPSPRPSRGVNPLLVTNVLTGLLVVVLTGLTIWFFGLYSDYKNNADSKITTAVDQARADQQKADEQKFMEREKLPTRTFTGPADLGSVTFQYPRTWSAYVAENKSSLEVYMHPDTVPPVVNTQPYALRVTVEDKQYDAVIRSYDGLVKKGSLRSNQASVEGYSGIRLDGTFTKEREGSAVVFKVRDKTLTVATDSSVFQDDFNKTVLQSLKFNP